MPLDLVIGSPQPRLPVQQPPHVFKTPSSFPPPLRQPQVRTLWGSQAPISQSRSGAYISPDPSPTTPSRHQREPDVYPVPSLTKLPTVNFARHASNGAQLVSQPSISLPRLPTFEPGLNTNSYRQSSMTPQRQKKAKTVKKTEGKQPTFLTKLYS